jgi:hypothetical protein
MPVIPITEQGGGQEKNNRKKWRAKEERHTGPLTPKKPKKQIH